MRLPVNTAFSPGRAISHGAEAVKRQPVGLLIGAFLMAMTNGGGGGGGSNFDPSSLDGTGMGGEGAAILGMVALGVACIGCCMGVVFWLFRSWLQPGYYRMHRTLFTTGTVEVSELFQGGDLFKRMALWKLLKALINCGIVVVAALPGGIVMLAGMLMETEILMLVGTVVMLVIMIPALVYVALGLVLGDHFVALQELEPRPALEASWELAKGNRISLLLYFFITGFFAILGLLACCVGIFFTQAIADAGTTEAFLLATRDDWEEFKLTQDMGGAY